MLDKRIVFTQENGAVSIIVPAPGATLEQCLSAVPPGAPYEIIDVKEVPSDRTFRNAWKKGEQGKRIGVDLLKAKDVSHEKRRAKRAKEFAPFDEIIAKQIPGKSAQDAEAARKTIRQKYDAIQQQIDAAQTPEELKEIIVKEEF